MKLFNKKAKPLSEYEKDAMWMSYRNAIGRHTIACVEHAGNMAKNVYHRLSNEEKKRTAFDIRREIASVLAEQYNFSMNFSMPDPYCDPFKALMAFSKTDKVRNSNLIRVLEQNTVRVELDENNEYVFSYSTPWTIRTIYPAQLHELAEWANVANVFDNSKHYIVHTKYDGKKKDYETFERIDLHEEPQEGVLIDIVYSDIKSYLEKPGIFGYMRKECITGIEPIK